MTSPAVCYSVLPLLHVHSPHSALHAELQRSAQQLIPAPILFDLRTSLSTPRTQPPNSLQSYQIEQDLDRHKQADKIKPASPH